MEADLSIHIYHSFDERLEAIWRRLQGDCDHYVFQSYDWVAYWQHTVGQNSYGIEPTIAVVSDSHRSLALFPLGIRRGSGVRVLEFLGDGQSDYNAPLILSEVLTADQVRVLWTKVLDSLPAHDVRCFMRMPQYFDKLQNSMFPCIVPFFCEGAAYATALPESWDEFRQRLPVKFQKDNARMIRRLSEIGVLEFVVADTDAEFAHIVAATLRQKERRYKETGARNILADINTRTFYQRLGECCGGDVEIHLSALTLNGEILATHLGAVYRERFYYLFPTFVGEPWSKFSPGRLLLEYLVQWAIANRLKIFDFTIGGEAYKGIWCDSEMPLYRMMEPLTIRGQIFVWVQRLIHWVKTNRHARPLAMGMVRLLNSFRYN